METTYGGQRAVTKMIASGVFDRHPDLKVIVSEGGATWGPFVADRLDEAYRQHASAVRPQLPRLPERVPVRERVRLVPARPLGGRGDDGDGLAATCAGAATTRTSRARSGTRRRPCTSCSTTSTPSSSERITVGAFEELFPHVPPAPANGTEVPGER